MAEKAKATKKTTMQKKTAVVEKVKATKNNVKESTVKEIKLSFLLSQFDKASKRTKFCFILGAGASSSSGIRMASELIEAWEKDLYESDTEESLAQWKEEKGIKDGNCAEFYGDYYNRRFSDCRDGYEYLEKEMEGKLPGSGYILLAHVLCHTSHNIVITTNFDHLIEDAVNQWEHRFPLVIGHESLAHFIADDMDRPVIIKIHHDLLLGPKNRNNETKTLDPKWQEHLPTIFSHYNPVFLGYAGNDLSLMNYLLENAERFKNGEWRSPYWTVYGKAPLSGKPLDFIRSAEGAYLRDCDFDGFMSALAQQVGYSIPPKEEFINQAKEKAAENYDRLSFTLNKKIKENNKSDPKENEQIINRAIMNITKDADNSDKHDIASIYREAIRAFDNKDFAQAENLFKKLGHKALYHDTSLYTSQEAQKAMELESDNARYHAILSFILRSMNRYKEALQEAQKAVDLEPNNAEYRNSLGAMLRTMGLYEEALQEMEKAVELEPKKAIYHKDLGIMLREMKHYDKALQEAQKAIELESDNAEYYATLGITLYEMKRYNEALEALQTAVDLDPNSREYRRSLFAIKDAMK